MYRVLFLADHAWRDPPALCAIRAYIEKFAPFVEVRIISFDLWQQAIENFIPHLVVLNHLHGYRNQSIAETVRRRGGLVAILPTEGRPNSDDRIAWAVNEWEHSLCDIYFSWSDVIKNKLPESVNAHTTGGPRFDFYEYPFRPLAMRQHEMRSIYGIDPKKMTFTIASSFPQGKFAKVGGAFNAQDWKDLKVTTIPGMEDPAEFSRIEVEAYEEFKTSIMLLRNTWRDAQIILKPHPAEAVWMWDRFCQENNIQLMLTGYIWDLLSMADVHIARADCMTACEAWMDEIPTVTFLSKHTAEFPGPGHEAKDLNPNYVSAIDILQAVDDAIAYYSNPKDNMAREVYIEKWLTPHHEASKHIAAHIINILEKKQPKTIREPVVDNIATLEKALKDHDIANASPRQDHIGQFGKAVRRSLVESWMVKVRDLI